MSYLFNLLKAAIVLTPWKIRSIILRRLFGYHIERNTRIGLSWIFPEHLVLEEGSSIGHFNVAIHLEHLALGRHAKIGRKNWITGVSKSASQKHYVGQSSRSSRLIIGEHSAITKSHLVDCTNSITIGRFTTIAGYSSQFLTHGINIELNRQESHPIRIGDYCLIGSRVIILGKGVLPDYSVLGAGSLLNTEQDESHQLYAGVPAKKKKALSDSYSYFRRFVGFVN